MDPSTGTFTTMDTYGGILTDPMSLHKYLFANSDPVMYCDPSGHFSLSEQMLVSALIGELISSTLYYVELFTTDNIQYDKPEEYIWGGLIAAIEGIIMGVAFCLLYMAFAFLTTAYIAGVLFGVSGLFMSAFGMLEGVDDIGNGDSALGWTKVIINAIVAVTCIISLANCAVSENVENGKSNTNNNEYIKGGNNGITQDDLLWGKWNDYEHITIDGEEYAKIGDRLYTQHAVERMQPSGMRYSSKADANVGASRIIDAGRGEYGRSISPNYVDYVINNGIPTTEKINGTLRTAYSSGSVTVITEDHGYVVVTILTK